MFFVGPFLRPVTARANLYTGLVACLGVLPLALGYGPLRGIPFYWRWSIAPSACWACFLALLPAAHPADRSRFLSSIESSVIRWMRDAGCPCRSAEGAVLRQSKAKRPGNPPPTCQALPRRHGPGALMVSPLQGWVVLGTWTQGDALGSLMTAPSALRKGSRHPACCIQIRTLPDRVPLRPGRTLIPAGGWSLRSGSTRRANT